MGAAVAQDEGNGLSGRDGELALRRQVLAAQLDRRAQRQHVGTGDRAQHAVIRARHPGHVGAVVEADDQLGPHRDDAAVYDIAFENVQADSASVATH